MCKNFQNVSFLSDINIPKYWSTGGTEDSKKYKTCY